MVCTPELPPTFLYFEEAGSVEGVSVQFGYAPSKCLYPIFQEVVFMSRKRDVFFATYAMVMAAVLMVVGCSSIPKGVSPVGDFDLQRYLGTWHEVARFDFAFERNLRNVTAEYSMNEDGSVKVMNRGYNQVKEQWQESEGRARFQGSPTVGALEVSFFGPFYSGYNVIAIDDDYQYALVSGKDLNYLWLLSRTPQMPSDVLTEYLILAESLGFDIDNLVWSSHGR